MKKKSLSILSLGILVQAIAGLQGSARASGLGVWFPNPNANQELEEQMEWQQNSGFTMDWQEIAEIAVQSLNLVGEQPQTQIIPALPVLEQTQTEKTALGEENMDTQAAVVIIGPIARQTHSVDPAGDDLTSTPEDISVPEILPSRPRTPTPVIQGEGSDGREVEDDGLTSEPVTEGNGTRTDDETTTNGGCMSNLTGCVIGLARLVSQIFNTVAEVNNATRQNRLNNDNQQNQTGNNRNNGRNNNGGTGGRLGGGQGGYSYSSSVSQGYNNRQKRRRR
ncbi:MAG: hypothetical protein LBI29_04650 [Rickettsiales bacterium]|jgi:hypothetical protein|nr:hypothetical protein [Rickettsiales bacterium]